MRCKLKLSPSKHMVYLFKMSARKYLSGAAKRKLKKQRIESDSKRRRTLEDLGWRPSSLTTPECTDQNDDDNGFDNMEQESNDSTESDVSSHNTSHEENPSLNDTTTVSNDPFKWKSELTSDQRIEIVRKGLPKKPLLFPRDSSRRRFPIDIFYKKNTKWRKSFKRLACMV